MFATLVIERGRESLAWFQVPAILQSWLLVSGALAGFGLLIWFLAFIIRSAVGRDRRAAGPVVAWLAGSVLGGLVLAVVVAALPTVWNRMGWVSPATHSAARSGQLQQLVEEHGSVRAMAMLFLAGFALVGVTLPIVYNATKLRWRRVWALAQLSMKEAIRSKILWAFSLLLLVFLFGSWFITTKPEQQVQTYVETVYTVMTVLLILTAGMLASLSIPNDLRRQTIHTIVTKPVERFEIVLGRFIGYVGLMSVVLAVMTLFSLIYVWRGVDPDAEVESLRARVPVFGDIRVERGRNVGRESGYRKYVGVSKQHNESATWTFYQLPAELANRPKDDSVRMEYGFDVFRTTKGEENVPVFCSFTYKTPQWDDRRMDQYRKRRDEYRSKMTDAKEIERRLAEEFGYLEQEYAPVEDNHTLAREVPAVLFQKAADGSSAGRPPLQVVVQCLSPTQYLGVAQYDLYLVQREGTGRLAVTLNFYKGAAGIWLLLCLVTGMAVTCSTYLNGVTSFLLAFSLLLAGLCAPFIQELAEHKSVGGGPMEALIRTVNNEPIAKPLDQTPTALVAGYVDDTFSWLMKRLLYVLPDVKHLSLTEYVARGFNISAEKLLLDSLLPLVGYLFLWVVLAYYLIKSREIAA